MTQLDDIARQLGTSGRTLRRAALLGTIRCAHPSPRRFDVEAAEREYVRRHWPLLGRMLQVLRTQPNVRLAVLFGSVSRGDDRADSDIDLVVRFAQPSVRALSLLTGRLEEEIGRTVQVVELESADESPLLLADVLRDGRVLVDRDGDWRRLRRRARQIDAAAEAENERVADDLVAAFDELFV
jgi:predicted nucleotidyltransferase